MRASLSKSGAFCSSACSGSYSRDLAWHGERLALLLDRPTQHMTATLALAWTAYEPAEILRLAGVFDEIHSGLRLGAMDEKLHGLRERDTKEVGSVGTQAGSSLLNG